MAANSRGEEEEEDEKRRTESFELFLGVSSVRGLFDQLRDTVIGYGNTSSKFRFSSIDKEGGQSDRRKIELAA